MFSVWAVCLLGQSF